MIANGLDVSKKKSFSGHCYKHSYCQPDHTNLNLAQMKNMCLLVYATIQREEKVKVKKIITRSRPS